jgi:hypothetical protein
MLLSRLPPILMRENEPHKAPEDREHARGARARLRSPWPVRWGVPVAVAVGWLAIIWFWKPSVLTLTVDDSFYALKTALNASRGRGLTFDGIHPTNGFHPWMWMRASVSVAPGSQTTVGQRPSGGKLAGRT